MSRCTLGMEPLEPRQLLAGDGFTAYNDHGAGPTTHANATLFDDNPGTAPGSSGMLLDIDTGQATGVTLSTTQVGVNFATSSQPPAPGTDAFDIFNGFVDFTSGNPNGIELDGSDTYTHAFSGLDPSRRYDFAGTSIRGNDPYTDRWTLVTLVGADSFTAAHSIGVGVVTSGLASNQAAIWVGANHNAGQGFVAQWTDIDPGADGQFQIVSSQYRGPTPGVGSGDSSSGSKGYALSGIRLVERVVTLQVVGSSIGEGTVVFPPPTSVVLDFNRSVNPATIQAGDLTVGGVPATGFTVEDTDRVRFNLPALGAGQHTIHIGEGLITDADGRPIESYNSSFTVPAPPTISNAPADNVEAFRADIGVSLANTGGDAPTVTFYWGTSDGGTNPAAWQQSSSFLASAADDYAITVTGLNSQTNYFFRTFAANAAGGTWAPATSQFTTVTPSLAAVEISPATQVGAYTATIGGEVTNTGSDSPEVTIFWGTTDGGTTAVNWENSQSLGIPDEPFDVNLAGLEPDQTYYYRALAENAAGMSWSVATLSFQTIASPLVINELMASNDTTISTRIREAPGGPLGDVMYPDWIEIYNPAVQSISLAGLKLVDSNNEWEFPPGTSIGAGGYLVVFASDEDITDPALDERGWLHTNFGLSAGGEYLALTTAEGTVIHQYAPEFPQQTTDISYGLSGQNLRYFATATPAAANSNNFANLVADTKFSVDRGFYDDPFQLAITTETPGATIRYTLNGSTPSTTSGTIYSGPITIDQTTTVRVIAYRSGYLSSNVDTQTYLFLDDVVTQSPNGEAPGPGWPTGSVNGQQLDYGMDPAIVNDPTWGPQLHDSLLQVPTLSIVTDLGNLFNSSSGIYVNPGGHGINWERPVSIELINPDGSKGFQENAGLRIRGGFSRSGSNPKHALRVFFRGDYGSGKLDFPLFEGEGVDEFDTFDLRTTQNYSWAFQNDGRNNFLRDVFSRDAMRDMGQPYTRSRYYHLYINDHYWGLFQTEERPEADFGASYFGGSPDDYDVVKSAGSSGGYQVEATDGNLAAYQRLWNQAVAGFSSNTAYYAAQGMNPDGTRNPALERLLDVDNTIDYMIVTYYTGDRDGPATRFVNGRVNNFFGIYNRENPDGFKWFEHDSEHSLDTGENNMVQPFSSGGAQFQYFNPHWLHEQLMSNAEYRQRFTDRAYMHLFNDGALSEPVNQARLDSRAAEFDQAIIAESARWGDVNRATPFTKNNWTGAVASTKNWVSGRLPTLINQLKAVNWYPDALAPAFSDTGGTVPVGHQLTLTNPNGGGTLYFTTDGSDPRAVGGGVGGSAQVYSGGPITIDDATQVNARVLVGGEWSPLDAATFLLETPPDLRISEIMYNPPVADVGAGELDVDKDEFEFVELANIGFAPISLADVRFTGGIEFDFATGSVATIQPGQRIVVVRDQAAFESRYGLGLTIAGEFANDTGLANDGEGIVLEGPFGQTIHDFSYNDSWYPATDGGGYSLVVADVGQDLSLWDQSEGWRPGSVFQGTPGGADAGLAVDTIVISEFLTHTDEAAGDWIELQNTTAGDINIGGWFLSDDPAQLTKYQIAANTMLPADDYVTFTQFVHFGNAAAPGVSIPFALSELGEQVILSSLDPQTGGPGGYRIIVEFAAAERERTFGRYVNSDGYLDYAPTQLGTPNLPNSDPFVPDVVINEIMYNPGGSDDEYIELYNRSGVAVPLYDPDNPENTWRFDEGIDFVFPENIVLPSGGYLLVVSTDPAQFRIDHSVPPEAIVLGPFSGALDNDADRIELRRPDEPEAAPSTIVPYVLVERIRYNDRAPWPETADGQGPTLARSEQSLWGNEPAHWGAGTRGGTPGEANVFTDATPPTAPGALTGIINDDGQFELRWTPASDPQSGIFEYRVFRDGLLLGTTSDATFVDLTATFSAPHQYEVSAINGDGLEGSKGVALQTLTVGFQDGSAPDGSYTGTRDAEILESAATTNFANGLTLRADADVSSGGADSWSLLKWDLSAVPAGARILGAALTINVTNASTEGPYYLYEMKRDWDEASVTWSQYTTGQPWQTAGARGPDDVGTEILGTLNITSTGPRSVDLSAAGIESIRQWINGTKPNYGFILQNPSNNDSLQFDSSETAIPANRPKLTLSYLLGDTSLPKIEAVQVGSSGWSPVFAAELVAQGVGSDGAYSIPGGAGQLTTLPFGGLDQIRIRFSEDVILNLDDLSLRGSNIDEYSFAGFAYDSATLTATWTLDRPLRTDKVLLVLSEAVTDLFGNRLDGDWTNGADTFPTGNGLTGTDDRFEFQLNVAAGDVDGDGQSNRHDAASIIARISRGDANDRYDLWHDVNGDGRVSLADVRSLWDHLGGTLPAGEPSSQDPGEVLIATDAVFQRVGGGGGTSVGTSSTSVVFTAGANSALSSTHADQVASSNVSEDSPLRPTRVVRRLATVESYDSDLDVNWLDPL